MKRITITVCVVVLVFAVAIIAQTPAKQKSGSVEQELIKLETEWGDAYVKRDATSIDKMLADDFISTTPDGTAQTKAQVLEDVKSHKDDILSLTGDEWKVRVYGDAAVVIARSTFKMQLEGKEVTAQGRFTDTWVKLAGRWKCVAGHASTIPQK